MCIRDRDLYGGGTNLKVKLTGDGMERKIYLSDYKWTPDDDIPGQIKFIFNTPDTVSYTHLCKKRERSS